jgi:DNA (cytosine-5)-methyltransferase 1
MGLLPKKLNELVMFSTEGRVLLSDIRRRRQIILTNAMFPEHRHEPNQSESDIENYCRLVCRWRMSIPDTQNSRYSLGAVKRQLSRGTIRRLVESEADKAYSVPDRDLREVWREWGMLASAPARTGKKYTFGDAFCGGGGMSTGAQMAGLTNLWAFDRDQEAIDTYRIRFPEAQTYHASVDEFLTLDESDLRVDVMHLSPPCQPHSPAHTTPGKDDEENEATGLAVSSCLRKGRPRYATLEQTFGLLHRNEWFSAVIASFTSEGFSVKWEVLQCEQYGVPQTRKRLFILAAW